MADSVIAQQETGKLERQCAAIDKLNFTITSTASDISCKWQISMLEHSVKQL